MRRLLALLALLVAACSGPADEEARYQRDLAAASEEARARLPWFWEHFEAPQAHEYDFALKVALPRRDGQEGAEDAWVENIARGPDSIVGELMVDPLHLGDLREGAIVTFDESQIVDWTFLRGEEAIGHYTTRVMLPRLPRDQADGLRSMFGDNPT